MPTPLLAPRLDHAPLPERVGSDAVRAGPCAPLRVLLMSGQPLTRRGLRDVLAAEPDIEVVGEAWGAEAALAVVARPGSPPLDLVLLDQTPSFDGLDAVRVLRDRQPDLPVVVLTAQTRSAQAPPRGGWMGHLPASLAPGALVRALRHFRAAGRLPVFDANSPVARPRRWRRGPWEEALELTPREREVARLLGSGLRDRDIAAQLEVGESTAKKHVENLRRKLGARNRTHAAMLAIRQGLA